jgi:hypothetical protein
MSAIPTKGHPYRFAQRGQIVHRWSPDNLFQPNNVWMPKFSEGLDLSQSHTLIPTVVLLFHAFDCDNLRDKRQIKLGRSKPNFIRAIDHLSRLFACCSDNFSKRSVTKPLRNCVSVHYLSCQGMYPQRTRNLCESLQSRVSVGT